MDHEWAACHSSNLFSRKVLQSPESNKNPGMCSTEAIRDYNDLQPLHGLSPYYDCCCFRARTPRLPKCISLSSARSSAPAWPTCFSSEQCCSIVGFFGVRIINHLIGALEPLNEDIAFKMPRTPKALGWRYTQFWSMSAIPCVSTTPSSMFSASACPGGHHDCHCWTFHASWHNSFFEAANYGRNKQRV